MLLYTSQPGIEQKKLTRKMNSDLRAEIGGDFSSVRFRTKIEINDEL